jgi:hypothetical protein
VKNQERIGVPNLQFAQTFPESKLEKSKLEWWRMSTNHPRARAYWSCRNWKSSSRENLWHKFTTRSCFISPAFRLFLFICFACWTELRSTRSEDCELIVIENKLQILHSFWNDEMIA